MDINNIINIGKIIFLSISIVYFYLRIIDCLYNIRASQSIISDMAYKLQKDIDKIIEQIYTDKEIK